MRGTSQAPSARSETRLKTPRQRYSAAAALMAVLALAMAFAASASANALGELKEYEPEGAVKGACPNSMINGPDGNVWFTGGGEIGRVTPAGVVTRFSAGLNAGAAPCEITVGPDGNFWFTDEASTTALGKITPSGTITEFNNGTNGLRAGFVPGGITAGPDGNVWFTDTNFETGAGLIGRITPSGTATEFPLVEEGKALSVPRFVTTGSDGKLWLTEYYADFETFEEKTDVVRISPAGEVTGRFSSGLQAGADVRDITAGPDGNLWFTDYGTTDSVCKITTAGSSTCYSSGLGSFGTSGAAAIAAGEDGNLWMTEEGDKLARVSTGGTITTFAVSEPEFHSGGIKPEAITAGPSGEGTVWFSGMKAPKAVWSFGIEEAAPNLKLNVEEGSGTVVSNPAGLECTKSAGGSCEAAVAEGKVTLTASPAPGYAFKSWKGCDTGGAVGRQCTVTATGSLKNVGVKFYKVWNLQATKSNGQGIFSTAPGGVNCGYGCLSSDADYKEGSLTLKAKAAKNFHFVEFTGGTGSASTCNGVTTETCAITINSDSSIEEVYAENAKKTLSLTKTGGGQGFIKTKPTNINCGYTCGSAEAEFFASETAVPVTVTLNKGTTSVTWSGGSGGTTCTSNQLSCTVDMSSAQSLTAEFK